MWHLIWVYTVCSGLSDLVFRLDMAESTDSNGQSKPVSRLVAGQYFLVVKWLALPTSDYVVLVWNSAGIGIQLVTVWHYCLELFIITLPLSWYELNSVERDIHTNSSSSSSSSIPDLSHLMAKPTKWMCAQQRCRSAWASTQSDQSLCCLYEESLGT